MSSSRRSTSGPVVWCEEGPCTAWTSASASSSMSPSCALQDLADPRASRCPGRGRRSRSARPCTSAWSRRAPGRAGSSDSRRPGRCRAAARPRWAGSARCRRPCVSPGPGWPARAISRTPLSGSTSTYRQVAKRRSRDLRVVVRDPVQEAGGAGEDRVRAVALGGVRAQRDPQLAHQSGGAYVVALDVADDQGEAAAPGARPGVPPGSGIMSYQSPPTWSPPPVGT